MSEYDDPQVFLDYFFDDSFETNFLREGRPVRDSEKEAELVKKVFGHYRQVGFPYLDRELDLYAEFQRLRDTPSCLKNEKVISQSMLGLSVVNAFHDREMVQVRCRKFKTPLEVFNDDSLLRQAIRNRIRYGDNLKSWGIRKAIFSLSRTQRVSNFRPSAAKTVYDHFKPRSTLDFSAGWGGRLLGAIASDVPYVGIDPNTTANNLKMLSALQEACVPCSADLINACAEDVLGNNTWGQFDLIFTSPPYFDAEQYSDAPTQSYIKFPDLERWYQGFLGRCITGSYDDLSDGGHLVLNVNPDMVPRVMSFAKDAGLAFVDEWKLTLSRHQYNKQSSGMYRYEPVLIFKKDR